MAQVVDESPPVNEVEKKDDNKICEVSQALNGLNLQKVAVRGFPFLELPDDCIRHIYPFFNIASRRVLRANGRLAEIESEGKYRYGTMEVRMEKDGLVVSSGGGKYKIPHSEVEKEFELLGKNTYFDEVIYKSSPSLYERGRKFYKKKNWEELEEATRQVFRNSVDFARILRAKKITMDYQRFDDDNLKSVVQNKDEVVIKQDEHLDDGYMWLYEMMRDQKLDIKYIKIESSHKRGLWIFMCSLVQYDYIQSEFYTDNPDQQVVNGYDSVTITEGRLKIVLNRIAYPTQFDNFVDFYYGDGFVSFEIIEEEEKGDNP